MDRRKWMGDIARDKGRKKGNEAIKVAGGKQ
jgi:hypothetical protein